MMAVYLSVPTDLVVVDAYGADVGGADGGH